MGFSVSGTYAVIFVGGFMALGTIYGAFSNAGEDVTSAQNDYDERLEDVQDTGINITDITLVDETTCDVNVTVNNTGETTLSLNDTDLFVDGAYEEDWESDAGVEGDGATDLWMRGEELEIDVGELPNAPDRVKVVSDYGVEDTREVSTLTC